MLKTAIRALVEYLGSALILPFFKKAYSYAVYWWHKLSGKITAKKLVKAKKEGDETKYNDIVDDA